MCVDSYLSKIRITRLPTDQMFGQIREKVSVKSITDSKVQIEIQWEPELVIQIRDKNQRLLISSEDKKGYISSKPSGGQIVAPILGL